MKIYLLRHCKTINNLKNSWSGSKSNPDLSEEGKKRNEVLIKELSQLNFDVIYSSPLKRCLQTSQKLSKLTNTPLIIDDRLIERDFGFLEGKPCSEEDKLKLCDLSLNTDLNQSVEKINDMYIKRIVPFYNDLSTKNYKKVLIVTHSWVVRLSKYFLENEANADVIKQTPINGKYLVYDSNKLISRNFNTVTIKGNKITKTSTYTDKFNDEINWMISLPEQLKKYIPKIYEYNISKTNDENNKSFITMEYIKEKSFDNIYIYIYITNADAQDFFNKIKQFLNLTNKFIDNEDSKKIKAYLYDIYYTKTIDRWNKIKDNNLFKLFYNEEFYINKVKYKPVKYYLSKLENILYEYDIVSENRKFSIIHGDLCFNNIIIKDQNIYLIDPRGSFGKKGLYGDRLYEMAKLSHSISGYDSIINNLYSINYKNNKINFSFKHNNNQQNFRNEFEKMLDKKTLLQVYLIESLLFLSMIPLHDENYEHQLMMLCLAITKISKYIK